jgi:hypothetical protein
MQTITALFFCLLIFIVLSCCTTIGSTSYTCDGTCNLSINNNKCTCNDGSACQVCPSEKGDLKFIYFLYINNLI